MEDQVLRHPYQHLLLEQEMKELLCSRPIDMKCGKHLLGAGNRQSCLFKGVADMIPRCRLLRR